MSVPAVTLSEVTTPAPTQVWREMMAADPHAMVTQSPEWLDALRSTSPYVDASHLFHFTDGRRVVLPLARHRHLPRGWSIEGSWPHDWGLAGPLADGPVTAEHARQVYACLLAETALQRSIRIDPRADPGWTCDPPGYARVPHFTQILDLGGGFDQVREQKLRGSVRRAARTAVSSGVEVEVDTSGRLLPVFHDLRLRSLRRSAARHHLPWLAARTQADHEVPLSRYAAVARHLGSACATWVAWYEGVPVASVLVLSNGRHARYWRGAVDSDLAPRLRADVLLHVRVIAWACATDHESYHLGDSRPDSRPAHFKASLGATPYHSVGYRSERLPLGAVESRALKALRRLAG